MFETGSPTMTVTPSSLPIVTGTPNTETPTATETVELSATEFQETQIAIATYLKEGQYLLATANQMMTDEPLLPSTPMMGILEGGWDVFGYPNHDVNVHNEWRGVAPGVGGVDVYAGSLHSDVTQGLVIVASSLPVQTHYFLTPLKAGAVRVVAEHNARLTMLSTDGITFYFDVPSFSFVESLTEIAPTITPAPTYTPYPTAVPPPTCTPWPDTTPDLTLPAVPCSVP